jgi:hypothetical protein
VKRAGSARRRDHHRYLLWVPVATRLLLTAIVIASAATGNSHAQQGRPAIVVATPLHIEASAQVALPVKVVPLSAVPPGCFVRLRGLPAMAALSDGHSIAPGAWAIPMAALGRLEILLPEGATGQSEISITLVAADGSVLAESRATLVVSARPAPATGAATAMTRSTGTPRPPTAAPSAPLLSPDARDRALRLVKKGDEQLADGGIAQARLLYERAAEAGLAQGAMSMAATYDPVELQRLGARGLKPDREEARRWYERARQLGAPDAEQRLRRLGAN